MSSLLTDRVDRSLDLRLVPAALTTWAVTVVGFALPAAALLALGGTAAVLALTGLWLTRSGGRIGSGRPIAAGVFAAVGCGAAAALLMAANIADRESSALRDLARTGAEARITVSVDDDARVAGTGFAGQDRVLVPAVATSVTWRGETWPASDPVVVLADAAGWSGLLPGQRAELYGRVRPALDTDLTVAAVYAEGPPWLIGRPPPVQLAAGDLRAGLRDSSAAVLPDQPAGLLPGLVVGDTSRLDPVLAADFRATGLTHLLAVSGANCAIVAGAVLWPLRRAGCRPWVQAAGAGTALVGFVVLARPSETVLRAAVMGGLTLVALAAGRERSALPVLSATVLILVLSAPGLAVEPGFTLSVAATAGILLLAPMWTDRLRGRGCPPVVAQALAVSASACMTTAPILVTLAPQVSLVSIPANLLAAPAVPVATVLGVLCAVVAPWWPDGGTALAWLAGWPTRWIVEVARAGAEVPFATVPWPAGVGGAVLLVLALGLLAWLVRRLLRGRTVLPLTVAALVGAVVVLVPLRRGGGGWPPADWVFVACDVGQGDALVIDAGPGQAVVVDAGPEPVAVDACLDSLGVERIPLVVLTHLHADHVSGLPGILHDRAVAELVVGPAQRPAPAWPEARDAATDAGVPIRSVTVGESWTVGGVRLDALGPVPLGAGMPDPNNASVVLRVSTHGHSLLLTGDVELEAQQALLDSGADLTADVLKVAHHGSSVQLPEFLDAVDASLAVISVGADNDYGHPAPLTVSRLTRLGMHIARTDTDGAVAVLVTEDSDLRVATASRDPPRGRAARRGRLAPARTRAVGRPGSASAGRASSCPAAHPQPIRSPVIRRPATMGAVTAAADLVPIRLVVGEDEFLRSRAVDEVAAAARSADPECEVRRVTASGLAVGELYELLSPSLFASRRVVVLLDAEQAVKDVVTAVTDYAGAPPADDLHLVVSHTGGGRAKGLVTALTKAGAEVVTCAAITRPEERAAFVRAEVRAHGGTIDARAAAALVDAVGNDLRELASAASQLTMDTGGRVDVEAVTRYHRGRAEVTGFAVADRAVVGEADQALEALRWALALGVADVLIADALADGVRSIARVASAGGASPYELANVLGMPPWKVKRARQQARGWTDEGLAAAVQVVAELNAAVKGEAADPHYALERAVLDVAAARRIAATAGAGRRG